MAVGIVILKRVRNGGFEIEYVKNFSMDRQVEVEVEL